MIKSKFNISEKLMSVVLAVMIVMASATIALTVGGNAEAKEEENKTVVTFMLDLVSENGNHEHFGLNGARIDYRLFLHKESVTSFHEGSVYTGSDSRAKIELSQDIAEKYTEHFDKYSYVYITVESVSAYGYSYENTVNKSRISLYNKEQPDDNLLQVSVKGNERAKLYGTVTDNDGNILKGADVSFRYYGFTKYNNTGSNVLKTDDTGKFTRGIFLNESYFVDVKADGFRKTTKEFTVKKSDLSENGTFTLPVIKLEPKTEDILLTFENAETVETVDYIANSSTYIKKLLKSDDNNGKETYTVKKDGKNTKATYLNGVLDYSLTGPGTYQVFANVTNSDYYFDKEVSFTVVVKNNTFQFGDSEVTIPITETTADLQPLPTAYTDKINYQIENADGTSDSIATLISDRKIRLIKSGRLKVTAIYRSLSTVKAVYYLNIAKVPADFAFDSKKGTETTYKASNSNYYTRQALVGGEVNTKNVAYAITAQYNSAGESIESGIAEINPATGKVKILAAGKVTVMASLAGSDLYEDQTISYDLTINKAKQKKISFSTSKCSITFARETAHLVYDLGVVADESGIDGKVTYEITSGNDCATIDASTGKIIAKKAGTVVVRATKTANEKNNYNDAVAEYTLEIQKGNPKLTFDKTVQDIVYGTQSYCAVPTVKPSDLSESEISINYTFKNISGKPIADINAATGEVTFNDGVSNGKARITATLTENSKYKSVSASYEISLNYQSENTYDIASVNADTSAHFTVTAADKDGWYNTAKGVVLKAKTGYLLSDSNLSSGTWKSTYQYAEDCTNKTLKFYIKKISDGSISSVKVTNLNIDRTAPEILSITYSKNLTPVEKVINSVTLGYYANKKNAVITIKAKDVTSKVASFRWRYDRQGTASDTNISSKNGVIDSKDITYSTAGNGKIATATFTLNENENEFYRGRIYVSATDNAGKTSPEITDKNKIIILDSVAPDRTVEFSPAESVINSDTGLTVNDYDYTTEGSQYNLYYKNTASAKFTVDEVNFDAKDIKITVENIVSGTSKEINNAKWIDLGSDQWQYIHTISGEGEYVIKMEYKDYSSNEMKSYISNKIVIDNTKPIISIDYSLKTADSNVKGIDCFRRNSDDTSKEQTAVITISEKNFNAYAVNAVVTAVDELGNSVDTSVVAKNGKKISYNDYFNNPDNWKSDGIKHTAEITFTDDAVYTFDIDYADPANNRAKDYPEKQFILDNTAPSELKMSFSKEKNFFEEVLDSLTLGYYSYQNQVTVTFEATDPTTGIESISWQYDRSSEASQSHLESDGGTFTKDELIYKTIMDDKGNPIKTVAIAKQKLTAEQFKQYRGKISFTAIDRAGNKSLPVTDDGRRIVIDNIAPTRTVEFSPAEQVIGAKSLKPKDSFDYTTEGSNYILIYKEKATATFTVTEANFHPDDVKITVTDVLNSAGWNISDIVWNNIGDDQWTGSYTLHHPGEYIIEMDYTDYSTNKMKSYRSNKIVISDEKPEINVVYSNKDVQQTIDSREYYCAAQEATVTIDTKYFYSGNVDIAVQATDALGNNVAVSNYSAYLKNSDNWENEGTKHTAVLRFDVDANYDIVIHYKNHANTEANAYSKHFTVDTTSPESLEIIYSPKESNMWTKIIDTLTFGYFAYNKDNSNARVTLKAKDKTTKIHSFKWEMNREENVSTINTLKKSGLISEEKIHYEPADGYLTATAEFDVRSDELEQIRGSYRFTSEDRSGNASSLDDSNRINIIDTVTPERSVTFSEAKQVVDAETLQTIEDYEYRTEGPDSILYYDTAATAVFEIKEANFDPASVVISVENLLDSKTENISIEWEQVSAEDWQYSLTLNDEGEYRIAMSGNDHAGNPMKDYLSNRIVIDKTNPVIDVQYDPTTPQNQMDGIDYFNAARTVTVTVKEDHFRPEDMNVQVNAVDANGKSIDYYLDVLEGKKIYPKDFFRNKDNWMSEGNVHKATVQFAQDANYTFDIDYQDLALRSSDEYEEDHFTVDVTAPTDLSIEYSKPHRNSFTKIIDTITFGYFSYNSDVDVTLYAKDETARIKQFEWSYTREDGTSVTNVETEKQIITDVKYDPDLKTASASFRLTAEEARQYRGSISFTAMDRSLNVMSYSENDHILVVDNISPTVTVEYSAAQPKSGATLYYQDKATLTFNMYESNFDLNADETLVKVEKTTVDGKKSTITPTLKWTSIGGDHWKAELVISKDSKNYGEGDYQVKMTYKDYAENEMKEFTSRLIMIDNTAPVVEMKYGSKESSSAVRYNGEDYPVTVIITEHNFNAADVVAKITAKDITGKNLTFDREEIAAYFRNDKNWKHSGNVHQLTYLFKKEANYILTVDDTDLADNKARTKVSKPFAVDHSAPSVSDMKISYDTPLNLWEEVLNGVTFGYYAYQKGVTVTLEASDDISGIQRFDWSYNAQSAHKTSQLEKDGGSIVTASDQKTTSVSFTLTSAQARQYRGNISFTATNNAGLRSAEKTDTGKVIIVDNISPERTVTFSEATQVVRVSNLNTERTYNYTTEGSQYKLYYDNRATATFMINEANFIAEDVNVKINGTRYTLTGWSHSGDTHTASLTLTDEGEYVITMEYKDRSNNQMRTYTSNEIVIDHTNPTINVAYSPDKVIRTVSGRKYYDAQQTATITVHEHNFRADDIAATVKAVDVSNKEITVTDYNSYLKNRNNWSRNGDIYTATITYSADANYTFDIHYKDLALRNAQGNNSAQFTVDKNKPYRLRIEYSKNILENILDTITFGYYNAPVTVTVYASDDTTAINQFKYSYTKANGVSNVNAQLLNEAIEKAAIQHNGSENKASFKIPKNVLDSTHQFNGTVGFVAYDMSDNSTAENNTKRIVVDNIKPVGRLSLSEPVKVTSDRTSYFNGKADVSIVINEANFNAKDVTVNVKNVQSGTSSEKVVEAKWTDNSTDIHTGRFTLSEEGEYYVFVNYTDHSNNVMQEVKSDKIVIDTKAPTIRVKGISHNEATNAQKIGFSIDINDLHLDPNTISVSLTAVVINSSGNFETKDIDLSSYITSQNASSRSYQIDNLKDDAVYTLRCSAADLAGNKNNKITLSDNKIYEKLDFSINRNGPTFRMDTNTKKMIENGYVYNVDHDIVIEEINVVPIKKYAVMNGSDEITKADGLTVELDNGVSKWCTAKYTISKDYFANEGEYKITVQSTDQMGVSAYSKGEGTKVFIEFMVDREAPVLTITGIEEGGRYQVGEQKVTVLVTDNSGKLHNMKIVVLDASGNPVKDASGKDISVRFNKSGKELIDYLKKNNDIVEFTIPEGFENQVKIYCDDVAVNAEGNTNETEKIIKNVTVSQNNWIIFYANKPVFYSVLIGVIAVIIASIFGIAVFIRKKRAKKS